VLLTIKSSGLLISFSSRAQKTLIAAFSRLVDEKQKKSRMKHLKKYLQEYMLSILI